MPANRFTVLSSLLPRSAAGRVWAILAGVLLLTLATAVLLRLDSRYAVVAPIALPGYTEGGWGGNPAGVALSTGTPQVLTMTARGGRRFPILVYDLPEAQRFGFIRVSAELAARDLTPGSRRWQRGRILGWSMDARGRRSQYLDSVVGAVAGTTGWRRVRLVVPVVAETAALRLVVYNAGAAGVMLARNLAIEHVAESQLFTAIRYLLIAVWAGVALWAATHLLARRRWRWLQAATVGIGAFILVATMAPQPGWSNFLQPVKVQVQRVAIPVVAAASDAYRDLFRRSAVTVSAAEQPAAAGNRATEGAVRTADRAAPARPDTAGRGVSGRGGRAVGTKMVEEAISGAALLAHFVAFALLGFTAVAGFKREPLFVVLGCLVVFAVADETLQQFSATRSTELDDYLWNLAGVACGALAMCGLRRLRRRLVPAEGQ